MAKNSQKINEQAQQELEQQRMTAQMGDLEMTSPVPMRQIERTNHRNSASPNKDKRNKSTKKKGGA